MPVVLHHAVIVFGARGEPWRTSPLRRYVGAQVHPRRVEPAEERCSCCNLPPHVVDRCIRGFVVDRLHALFGEGPGVLNCLLTNSTPTRMDGRIIISGHLAAQNAAGAELLPKAWIARIVAVLWLFLGVEVVQIAEKFIEAMHRRQILIAVTEMVLAELAGGVAARLE